MKKKILTTFLLCLTVFKLQHPVEAKIHPAQRPFRLKHSNKLKAFLRPRMNLLKLNHKQKA